MFCPKCGQQQMSSVRYCSRCGFSLRGVLSVRRKDIVQGLLLMFIGLFFLQFFMGFVEGLLGAARAAGGADAPFWSTDRILNLFSAGFIIWGLSRIVFALITELNSRRKQQREALSPSRFPPLQVSESSRTTLPRSRSVPGVEPDRQPLDTAELVEPPSGTEEPTRLLGNG